RIWFLLHLCTKAVHRSILAWLMPATALQDRSCVCMLDFCRPNNTAIYNYVEDGEQRSTSPSFFTLVDLDYFIGRNIASNNRCRTALGLVFSADVQALNYVYGRLGSFGYYSFFGLGLGLKHEQAVGRRGVVTAALHVPLVGWQARSPYLVNDDEFIENTMSHSGVKTFLAFVGDGSFNPDYALGI